MEEMAGVEEVARIVTSTLHISQAGEKFIVQMKKLVEFDLAGINVIDSDAGTYTLKAID